MQCFAPLPIGTRVVAVKSFGPIMEGQKGIVTGLVGRRWWRATCACTFLGGINVAAPGRHIARPDHGCSWQMLEDPFWFLRSRLRAGPVGRYAAEVRRSPDLPTD